MGKETLLGRKPYDFVPLVSQAKRETIKGQDSFSKETYSGKLNIKIHTLSPLHINQGVLGFNQNETELVNKTTRRAGKVVIPGSSIKGVIRSIAESISYSCPPRTEIKEGLEGKNKYRCNGSRKQLCPPCSIFGMTGKNLNYRGKVKFGEFHLEKGQLDYINIPSLFTPFRNYSKPPKLLAGVRNHGNERLYYCKACSGREEGICKTCSKDRYFRETARAGRDRDVKLRGRKFYYHNLRRQEKGNPRRTSLYEVVMKGSSFAGSMTYENLSREELAILVFSLGMDKSFNPKMGYGKPAFYGSVDIELDSVEDLLSRYRKSHKAIDEDFILKLANNYYQESGEELQNTIDKLRDILDKDKNAPDWPNIDGNKVY